jgi:ribosomal protein S18 acetylase RimI-like enzyme
MSIVQAQPQHHLEASLLLHQSGPASFDHVFHISHGPHATDYLAKQFESNKTMFSHKHHLVWEEEGKAIGTLLLIDKPLHDSLFLQNAFSIFKHYGIRSILKGLRFEFSLVKPPKKARFYIGHIAVNEKYRGKGIARKLITRAEEEAKSRGYSIIALDVAAKNLPALGLYELLGYKQIHTNKSYHSNLDDHIYMEKKL